jgi:hypothetical protein
MSTADGGGRREMSEGMSFSLSFHQALLGPTAAHWLDDPSDLSSRDSTQQYAVDGSLLSCNFVLSSSSVRRCQVELHSDVAPVEGCSGQLTEADGI